jgi:hypothetical protein
MKFNPITKTLYTDDNQLIKKMYCPYPSLKWDEFSSMDGTMNRFCDICESSVVETKEMSDESLLSLLREKPDTCLKIDWNQENIKIVHHV